MRRTQLRRSFYARDPLEVAPDLLGKVLCCGDRGGRIVEVEAYRGADDPASHAHRGLTPRTEVMFGPAGHLYVYFTYGMHWCANVVTSQDGVAGAVLLRALEPLGDLAPWRAARPAARRDEDLANGPAKLCQALGIDGAHNGLDLVAEDAVVRVVDDGIPPPPTPVCGPRIGIRRGTDLPWRFSTPDSRFRSKPW